MLLPLNYSCAQLAGQVARAATIFCIDEVRFSLGYFYEHFVIPYSCEFDITTKDKMRKTTLEISPAAQYPVDNQKLKPVENFFNPFHRITYLGGIIE